MSTVPALAGPACPDEAQTRELRSILGRRVWHLAIPAIGENLLATLLLLVDTLMIAPFGKVPLAASAVAGILAWRTFMTFGCIEKGTTALVARNTGAGDLEKVAVVVAQSIWLALGIGLLMGCLGWFLSERLLIWIGAAPDVVAVGTPFLQVILLASVPRMFFFVASASLRGAGDTRSPMWVTLCMNFTNIAFNYPLIFGLNAIPSIGFPGLRPLGLTGSGISTAMSITLASCAIGWILYHGRSKFQVRRRHFRFNWPVIKSIWRIGMPSLFEEFIITIGFLMFFSFITQMGTVALAAHSIATRVESLSFMAGLGFTVAAATLVGQSLGQKNVPLARLSFRISTRYCVMLMSLISVLLIVFSADIVHVFAPGGGDPLVEKIAATLLCIAAIEQPLLGVAMTLGGGLRGAGDTVRPMFTSLAGSLIVRITACYILTFPLGMGIYGIYVGTFVDWAVRSLMMLYFFRRERWAKLTV
ncbi:MAG: MATE family efflux transporter [Candidatus Sumerlaeaceae bacterium]